MALMSNQVSRPWIPKTALNNAPNIPMRICIALST
jgi:hypothetical protein